MRILSTIFLLLLGGLSFAQFNLDLKSNVDFDGNGNDIWGYVAPDGAEYAIVGTTLATRVYSLEDTSNPIERMVISGSNSTWRDMKQWGEYVYVTCDSGNDGLLVIDMTQAPDEINFNFIYPEVYANENQSSFISLDRCHNIFIDEKGLIMLSGCREAGGQGRGAEFFDPTDDPMNPTYLGSIISPYFHDIYAKGDTLYGSDIYGGRLAMYDISNLDNVEVLGSVETSSDFTHNAWADPTNSYAFTTDEREEGFVDSYDVTDPTNIERLDKFMPPGKAGTGTIPHNTHYLNGYLVTSWYTAGVIIIDANKPDNLIQVAEYDTYDGPDGGFSGCWGVTPFLPSGIVIANDINSGLYVFDVDYIRACYLEGKVTDINTNASISNVEINIESADAKDPAYTEANGEYRTGQASSGTYMVTYSHPLYESKTVEVTLDHGEVTIQDIELGAKPVYTVNILAIEDENGIPLPNAKVALVSDILEYELKTDENGEAAGQLIEGNYVLYAGLWGYHNIGLTDLAISGNQSYTLKLPLGYMDDFILDLGWTVENQQENNNFSGAWERAEPYGTYDGSGKIYNPEFDAEGDLGDQCYVTENEIGASASSNDVDNGITTLSSPVMDLTAYENPSVQYKLWFVTGGGSGPSDDEIIISVSNGIETVEIQEYNNSSQDWTNTFTTELAELITITDNMQIHVETSDLIADGHRVEAGFDQFFVQGAPVNNEEIEAIAGLTIYPSPASDQISINSPSEDIKSVELINSLGQSVKFLNSNVTMIDVSNLPAGSYFARIQTVSNKIATYPVQIVR